MVKDIVSTANTISLVIGTHNPNTEWLSNAITSAEGLFDEIIIVDDGSDVPVPGATVRHETQKGFFEARNTGCSIAKGTWIASLDDDDEFIRQPVIELKKKLSSTNADVLHFPCTLFGEMDGIWGNTPNMPEILNSNQIPSGSWFKKTVWEKLNGFQLELCEDWDFWARAWKHGMKFEGFPTPLYLHRMRKGSMSWKFSKEQLDNIRQTIRENYEKERI